MFFIVNLVTVKIPDSNISLKISTDSFTKEENDYLQWILKCNFNIRSKVCEYTRNNKKYYYMSLNKENSLKMTEIIAPYSQDSMKYKLITAPQRLNAELPEKEDDTV